ncbi:septation protein SepH [Arcanobacterium hippocoleae]
MIELEFLGLDATGEKLTFNDADGNRYETVISAELRGALRKDLNPVNHHSETNTAPKAASPKEIQAYFRSGMTISQVSEICSLPPLQLSKLASPILSERNFIANQARSYQKNQDSAEMRIDELVVSRLLSRGVNTDTIKWDAVREAGAPWILIARYIVADKAAEARWQVNSKAHFITPLNDEATWLTDTPLPTPNDPWRPLNTPKTADFSQARNQNNRAAAGTGSSDFAAAQKIPEKVSVPAKTENTGTEKTAIDIDAVLVSLDEQRGISQPTPSLDELPEFQGAHPAYSEPENAQDAQILKFPDKQAVVPGEKVNAENVIDLPAKGEKSEDTAAEKTETAAAFETLPGLDNSEKTHEKSAHNSGEKTKGKSRRGRPEMPSWDEIIYGYSKERE